MSFHICCTYPLIYRMQLSTPSCPGNLTNHPPHTLEKKHRQGEETTESAIVLQTLCLCYAMLCYAMLCSSNRSRSQDASALRPPRISDRRSKMNVRRPQEIQHERQEAPAGPKLKEASGGKAKCAHPEAVGSCREPPGALKIEHYVLG